MPNPFSVEVEYIVVVEEHTDRSHAQTITDMVAE